MDTIADLIEAARIRTGANYTEIGERLERSKQLVTNWRKGDKVPGDGDVMALARMAGENADKWLAIAQAARTEGEAKARWQQIARRLTTTATLLAVGFLGALPAPAQAAYGHTVNVGNEALCEIQDVPLRHRNRRVRKHFPVTADRFGLRSLGCSSTALPMLTPSTYECPPALRRAHRSAHFPSTWLGNL